MPTYDYACQACGHEFEIFQQMREPLKRKCPECGRLKLQRLIGTGAGVIFKGGGFYETDYRSESYKKGAEAEKKAAEPAAATGANGTNGTSCACGADAKTQAANGCNGSSAQKPVKKSQKKPATSSN